MSLYLCLHNLDLVDRPLVSLHFVMGDAGTFSFAWNGKIKKNVKILLKNFMHEDERNKWA